MRFSSMRFTPSLWATALLLCLVFVLHGCDNDRIAQTEEGFTTESEVIAKWGPPENVWINAQGERVLEYNRQPEGTANYMITVGADGKVVSLRNALTRQNFAQIQPGMMMEDVRKLLGRPAKTVPYALKKETVFEWRWREGTGGAPFRRFIVTADSDWKVKSTADVEEPSKSEGKR